MIGLPTKLFVSRGEDTLVCEYQDVLAFFGDVSLLSQRYAEEVISRRSHVRYHLSL